MTANIDRTRVFPWLAATLACLPGLDASAQQWSELGPNGGYVALIAAGPPGSGKVFVTQGARIFASTDNGYGPFGVAMCVPWLT